MTHEKPIVFLPLSQGKVAVIDFDDFEKVRDLKWCAVKGGNNFYAASYRGKKYVSLHRIVTDCPPNLEVNHINGDGLDNRRENLQVCTCQQNLAAYCRKKKGASSKYRGVARHTQTKRWQAYCKNTYLGIFDSEEKAALAYNAEARELGFSEEALNNI